MSKKNKSKMLPDLSIVTVPEPMKPIAVTPVVETPVAATEARVPKIVPVQLAIMPLMKTAKTIADLAAAATKKLGADVTERQVRLAIDRARRGTNKETPIKIDRVAPNTFQIVA